MSFNGPSGDAPSVANLVETLKPSLNAAVICLSHSWGGLEQVAAADALELGSRGLKVRLLCLPDTPIHRHLVDRPEVTCVPLPFLPRNLLDLKMRTTLQSLIGSGINLIHLHQPTLLGSVVPWVVLKPQVALLATRHILSDHSKKDPFHALLYARLDSLIVMSHALRRNVLQTHAIRPERVKLVNLGLDFDAFDPNRVDAEAQRSRWGADRETLVIGMVGRIDPAKGQATFIRSAAGLAKTLKPSQKVKFVIVGEETLGGTQEHLATLKEMVSQFRLESSIVFAGFQSNIPEVMRAFDVFVMPSRQETFGLVAIEAMAMERPIVISSGGSAEEIVGERGEFGVTMRPEDAFDLQVQLRRLMDDPSRRQEMGRRAREHVVRQYDRRLRFRQTLEIYEQSIRKRGMMK